MERLATACALAVCFAGTLSAQAITLPANAAGVEGSTSNNFPFGFTSPIWPGLRIQACYDSSNLTTQGVSGPITVTRIRWRTNQNNAPAGGTFSNATIAMGTAAVDYSAVTTNFATNVNSLTTVYSGPVNVDPVPSSTPGGWYVSVLLTTPFTYDPTLGDDLIIDTDHDLMFTGGGSASHDISGPGSMSSRVFASSNYPAANGTTQNHGIVVELCFEDSFTKFAAGCPGSLGIPDLVPFPGSAPEIGTVFQVEVTNVPFIGGMMVLGLSKTFSNNFGMLPFDCSPGAPGCFLHVSDESVTPLAPLSPTSAFWTLPIPNNPEICGLPLYNQAIVWSPGTNPLNCVDSDSYEIRVGY